jgi:hypothetical protein
MMMMMMMMIMMIMDIGEAVLWDENRLYIPYTEQGRVP